MGQQQLLLLVLSTVIVGLATVAGIQAFSENQAQASQDALVQRGTSIASDIQGLAGKPSQMGGIDLNSDGVASGSEIVNRLGYESKNDGEGPTGDNVVAAQGAGSDAGCTIADPSGDGSATITCEASDAPQDAEITVTPANSEPISTSFSSSP